jgi:16S rRNA (guanine(966)-N(2))-methyltransferase RsmD
MKIIAGLLRGKRFPAHSEKGVKPISGRIKQSLFDILAPVTQGARFLDLFAGTGAVGFEALSRGGGFSVFIEQNKRCARSIEENIRSLNLGGRAKVFEGNVLEDLSWISFRSGIESFDIVFLGPPYRDAKNTPLALSSKALERVVEAGLVAKGGLVISQRHIKEKLEVPQGLKVVKETKYGDTLLSFMRLK